jgi:hypothetical protein
VQWRGVKSAFWFNRKIIQRSVSLKFINKFLGSKLLAKEN